MKKKKNTPTRSESVVGDKVKIFLSKFRKDGKKTIESIAVDLDVSYPTIISWASGRRIPRIPMVRHMESTLGVKIL